MRPSKSQKEIIERLQNDVMFIKKIGGMPYIVVKNGNSIKSEPMHCKTFDALCRAAIIKEDNGRWTLNEK